MNFAELYRREPRAVDRPARRTAAGAGRDRGRTGGDRRLRGRQAAKGPEPATAAAGALPAIRRRDALGAGGRQEFLGLSESGSWLAWRRGDIPSLKSGRYRRVPVDEMRRSGRADGQARSQVREEEGYPGSLVMPHE